MGTTTPFKWRHFEAESIVLCVRSLRALCAQLPGSRRADAGAGPARRSHHDLPFSSNATLQNWSSAAERISKPQTTQGLVDEPSVKIKGIGGYLYRAVDAEGQTLEFLLSPTRTAQAAKRFFSKALAASHTVTPRVITVDKNAAYPKAFQELKAEGLFPKTADLRQVKYLNTLVEQDHRFIKRLVKPGLGFFSLETAWRTLQGYEVMNMLRKGQRQGVAKGAIRGQMIFIATLFGVAA